MGFWNSFQKSFQESSQSAAERQANSTYRTLAERRAELEVRSDTDLLGKLKSPFTGEDDKRLIGQILKLRGYTEYKSGGELFYRRDY